MFFIKNIIWINFFNKIIKYHYIFFWFRFLDEWFCSECFIYEIKIFICSILEWSGISNLQLYNLIWIPFFSPLKIFIPAINILIFLDYRFFSSFFVIYFILFGFKVSFQCSYKDFTIRIFVSTVKEILWVHSKYNVRF